jgi:hypothetical protein
MAAGDVKGQGVAGQWHVISPSGKVITKQASSSAGSGSGYGSGYGSGGNPY